VNKNNGSLGFNY